jgi:DNA repair protein RadC
MESTNENQKWVAAEIRLVYKNNVKPSERPRVTSSRDSFEIFRKCWDDTRIELQEQFKAMFLNRAHKVFGIIEISSDGIAGTVADPKLIMIAALKAGASGIVLAHNHPSGDLSPSPADIELTKKLKNAGVFLEIRLLNLIIVTVEGYTSFADEGLI